MKKCFLFVAIACVLSVLSQAQVYNFPVRPGTETWSNLVTEEDRFSAMQIPEDQLVSMSTQDLVITCMNYPAWLYFTAFNNPQDGIDINIHNFNGLLHQHEDGTGLLSSLQYRHAYIPGGPVFGI